MEVFKMIMQIPFVNVVVVYAIFLLFLSILLIPFFLILIFLVNKKPT